MNIGDEQSAGFMIFLPMNNHTSPIGMSLNEFNVRDSLRGKKCLALGDELVG